MSVLALMSGIVMDPDSIPYVCVANTFPLGHFCGEPALIIAQ